MMKSGNVSAGLGFHNCVYRSSVHTMALISFTLSHFLHIMFFDRSPPGSLKWVCVVATCLE